MKRIDFRKAFPSMRKIIVQLLAILLPLLLGAIIIRMIGIDPIKAYRALYKGALGSKNAISETLVKTTPLILTGLSYAFAVRSGLINIGAEGQLYIGGLCATIVGAYIGPLPPIVHIPLAICAGFIGGALWGGFVGFLKVACGSDEIITTVMLNYVAIFLISYTVTGPLKEPPGTYPQSRRLYESATLPKILSGTRLHIGLLIALICIAFYFVFMWHTRVGYEIRVVGKNQQVGRYAGMNPKKLMFLAMVLAGGMAGLAGSFEIMGLQGRLIQSFSPGYGFDGIAVALVGLNHPIGIVLGALLFGALRSGGNMMQMTAQVPLAIIYIIQGLVIVCVIIGQMYMGKRIFFDKKNSTSEGIGGPVCSKQ